MMARDFKTRQGVRNLDFSLQNSLESALDAALHPVGPRREYQDHLRSRLMEEPYRSEDDEWMLQLVLGGAGAISVLLLILASVRLVQNMRRGRS